MDDTPSRGDQLLEELKATRKRPAQFSVVSVLILTFVIAALFAVARATGDMAVFFAYLYFALCVGLPLVAYAIAGLMPGLSERSPCGAPRCSCSMCCIACCFAIHSHELGRFESCKI